jgi:Xaa-Pro dipeptidase
VTATMEDPVIGKLRAAMRADGFDALVAHSLDNATYTAGFQVPTHAMNRFRRTITVLAAKDFECQIVVNVEEAVAREKSRFEDIRTYNQFTQNPADILADALEEAGVGAGRIAIELDYLPAMDFIRLIERLPDADFVHARDLYFRTRMVKTNEEIATLRNVGAMTERVIADVVAGLRPGVSERKVGTEIMNRMLDAGADAVTYQVGSGARSGIINCKPTDKLIEPDDVVRIEVLGDKDGHRSNVTRTMVMGKPTQEQKQIWSVLIGARDLCESMLKPGTRVPDLWNAYLGACRAKGIEPSLKFLGHGIGRTIHEEPYLTETRDVALLPGVTHTMEPLYMVPGRMGFHVEDMYLITTDGFEKLTGHLLPNDQLIEAGS